MKFIVIDVDKAHAIGLWKRICMPHRFYPDIFIVENCTKSIVSFVDGMEDSLVAIPIRFRIETEFHTDSHLIIHERSNIISRHMLRVHEYPASSHVIYRLLCEWRTYRENSEVYKTRFMVTST